MTLTNIKHSYYVHRIKTRTDCLISNVSHVLYVLTYQFETFFIYISQHMIFNVTTIVNDMGSIDCTL